MGSGRSRLVTSGYFDTISPLHALNAHRINWSHRKTLTFQGYHLVPYGSAKTGQQGRIWTSNLVHVIDLELVAFTYSVTGEPVHYSVCNPHNSPTQRPSSLDAIYSSRLLVWHSANWATCRFKKQTTKERESSVAECNVPEALATYNGISGTVTFRLLPTPIKPHGEPQPLTLRQSVHT